MGKVGTLIGEGYAKQGLSWDKVSSMPSIGDGPGRNTMRAGVKTGYDNYMANNPQSIGSANMIQSPGGSGGLAASAVKLTSQPTLMSGIQNTAANSAMFGNRTNGLGESRFGAQQGLAASSLPQQGNQQNEYQILGAPRII